MKKQAEDKSQSFVKDVLSLMFTGFRINFMVVFIIFYFIVIFIIKRSDIYDSIYIIHWIWMYNLPVG